MAKPRNWLAVHAHHRGGAGPHTDKRPDGPSIDDIDADGTADSRMWDAMWDEEDWGVDEFGIVVIEEAVVIPTVATNLGEVIASSHVHARDPEPASSP